LLESGAVKRMDELEIGDVIHVGNGKFSEVFMFTHRVPDTRQQFLAIKGSSDVELRLTAGHYLYVNGGLRSAGVVKVGDEIELADGGKDVVVEVRIVAGFGLYNPQTVDGDIAVNGVRSSTYTTAVDPVLAHAILAPLRAAYRALGWSTAMLENGSDLSRGMPSGTASVTY
jgi:Hint module